MKLLTRIRSDKALSECDYQAAVEFVLQTNNCEHKLDFYDGEPEDNNLGRNFSGVFGIEKLIKAAYEAGFNREKLEVVEEESDDM